MNWREIAEHRLRREGKYYGIIIIWKEIKLDGS